MTDEELLERVKTRIEYAMARHPVFAEGVYQGLGRVGEEYGELVKAVTKGEDAERILYEALDLIAVAWRFARGDYKVPEEKPKAKDACILCGKPDTPIVSCLFHDNEEVPDGVGITARICSECMRNKQITTLSHKFWRALKQTQETLTTE